MVDCKGFNVGSRVHGAECWGNSVGVECKGRVWEVECRGRV